MEARWHNVPVFCPKCSKSAWILKIKFMANGDILVEALCVPCGEEVEMNSNIQKIMAACVELDILRPMEDDLRKGESNE